MEIAIKLPKPHPAQAHILANMRRFTVLCCGRRWGKTALAQIVAVQAILAGKQVAFAAPVYRQTKAVWRNIRLMLKPITTFIDEQDKQLATITGGGFTAYSLDSGDAIRSAGFDLFIVDEAAFVPKLDEVWPKVLRPLLTDRQGRALFISTPNGMSNYFYALYSMQHDYPAEWVSYHYPTVTNPHIKASEVEAARSIMPVMAYEQEYLAKFIVSEGAVFSGVDDVVSDAPRPDKWRAIAGLDFGNDDDYTALSIIDADSGMELYVNRWRHSRWDVIRANVVEACQQYGVIAVYAERNSVGAVNIEALSDTGLQVQPFTTSNKTKSHIVGLLKTAIEKREVTLLDVPFANDELRQYAADQTALGAYVYSAPKGLHDDTVMARMLAWFGVHRYLFV